jgi:hypothetical protein
MILRRAGGVRPRGRRVAQPRREEVSVMESDEKEQGTPQQDMQSGGSIKPQSEEPEESGGAETAGDAAKEKQG